MADWDDSDDDWDKSDDELDKRLGLVNVKDDAPPAFDDEDEDLTLKDKEREEQINAKLNKAKGSALKDKKAAEAAAKEELELARKAMAMEAEMEANMTPEERRQMEREREEADAKAMADDLFGGVDDGPSMKGPGGGKAMMAGDKVVMKDLKDHLRHAKKIGECIQVSSIGALSTDIAIHNMKCIVHFMSLVNCLYVYIFYAMPCMFCGICTYALILIHCLYNWINFLYQYRVMVKSTFVQHS